MRRTPCQISGYGAQCIKYSTYYVRVLYIWQAIAAASLALARFYFYVYGGIKFCKKNKMKARTFAHSTSRAFIFRRRRQNEWREPRNEKEFGRIISRNTKYTLPGAKKTEDAI